MKPSTKIGATARRQDQRALEEHPLPRDRGPHKLGVTFLRRTFAESDDQLQLFVPGGGQDRVSRVSSFEVAGPFNATGLSATPSRERIFVCHPAAAARRRSCAPSEIVATLASARVSAAARRRRSAAALRFYREGAANGGSRRASAARITGILASPYFLYRGELPPTTSRPAQPIASTIVELASKLSFFLWNTIPDDELRDLAATRQAQRRRRCSSSRSRACSRTRAPRRSPATSSSMARHEAARRGRARSVRLPVRRPRRSAQRLHDRARAVRESIFDEDRSVAIHDGEAHVRQRALALALRHQRREGRPFPTRRARRLDALGLARQRRAS